MADKNDLTLPSEAVEAARQRVIEIILRLPPDKLEEVRKKFEELTANSPARSD